jgi:hypothetical protein
VICWVWVCLGQADDREFLIRVSYMEIYNEEINDLLTIEGQKLRIHESLEVSTHLDIFSLISGQVFVIMKIYCCL